MTLLLMTVTRDAAWLTQDGIVQLRRILGLGPLVIGRRRNKIVLSSAGSTAFATCGPTKLCSRIVAELAMAAEVSIDAVAARIPHLRLSRGARLVPFVVNAVGWSPRRERMLGLSWCNDGEQIELDECVDSESVNVDIVLGHPESAELEEMDRRPPGSWDMARRHLLIGVNATRQSKARQLPNHAHIGGRLQTVRVTRDGAEIVQAADLDALAA